MGKRLVLLSTGVGLVGTIVSLVKKSAPGVDIVNIVDDSIVPSIRDNGNVVPPAVFARMSDYCRIAEDMGADALLLTCSSISEAVDHARPLTALPLFKIDEPMAEEAVRRSGKAVGVAATLMTTLNPTERLIKRKIADSGKELTMNARLCEGAFEAYLAGDRERHDALVREGIMHLLSVSDCVALAQASMATAIESMPPDAATRVLTSPESGIARVARFLND